MTAPFFSLVEQAKSAGTAEPLDRAMCLKEARAFSENRWAGIRERHNEGEAGTNVVHDLSDAADRLLIGAFQFALASVPQRKSLRQRVALAALGSFGRRELSPYSDLDVCLIYDGALDKDIEALNDFLVPFLWDLGFKVGYTIHSIPEACKLAREDLYAFTSIWQARHLAGSSMVFARLKLCVRDNYASQVMHDYIQTLIRSRFEDLDSQYADLYAPAPNIKENKGGLRDFHVGLWLFMLAYDASNLDAIEGQGLITPEEHLQIAEALDFVWRVRNELHFKAGRADDDLTYENQVHCAHVFHYSQGENHNIARFMEDYYAASRRLRRFLRLAARSWSYSASTATRDVPTHAISGFATRDGELYAGLGDPNWFSENPVRLMEVYWACARHDAALSHATERMVMRNLHLVNQGFRESDLVRRFFVAICSQPIAAGSVLRQMARSGLLGKYIPEFEAIQGTIRYEDFHHYPVDEHTLRAIEAIQKLEEPQDTVSRCLRVTLEHLSDPHILVLAILFHDLGKVAGDVHTEESERITREIGKRIGLPEADIEHIAFIVRHHILMTHISQYRDIDDEDIVRSFAGTMKTEQRLRELFILSYCDLSAVGPNVWNDWKGALLMKLYLRTERMLLGRADSAGEEFWKSPKAEAVVRAVPADRRPQVEPTLRLLGDRYFTAFSVEQIALHLECLHEAHQTGLAVRLTTQDELGATEVVVCTRDRRGRFDQMAGCFAASLADVKSAALFGAPGGFVLDCFTVTEARRRRPLTKGEMKALEDTLRQVLLEEGEVQRLVDAARRRLFALLQPSFPVRTQITFDNHSSRLYTVIDVETGDRTGLLYDIARAIMGAGLDIATARIVTDSRRVRDSFYVSAANEKIEDTDRQRAIREVIHHAIHPRAAVDTEGEAS